MKRISLIVLALAVVSIGGCQMDDVVIEKPSGSQAIQFTTYLGNTTQTKGLETGSGTSVENTSVGIKTKGFGITAFYTGSLSWAEWNVEGTADVPNFMYNQKVEWKENGWEYSPVKYWPAMTNDNLSFFAYAPYSSNGITPSAKTDAGTPTIEFEIQQNASDMVDFVAGNAIDEKHNVSTPDAAGRGAVNFKLYHELTRLNFKAKVDVDNDSAVDGKTYVVVKSAKLNASKQFYKKATYTFNDADMTGDIRGTWEYESATPSGDYSVGIINAVSQTEISTNYNANGIAVKDDIDTDAEAVNLFGQNQYLFLIPVSANGESEDLGLAEDGMSITFDYDIVTVDDLLTNGFSCTRSTKTVYLPKGIMRQGVAYNLIFTFSMNAIEVSAEKDNWKDADGDFYPDGDYVELAESNSYIINPSHQEGVKIIYGIPIKNRINDFWSNYADEKSTPIDGTNEWIAEVIWQDSSKPMITFSDEFDSPGSDTYRSADDKIFFHLIESDGGVPEGNILIGVKRASDAGSNDYLWSWHLWITDYDPDYQTKAWDARYVYEVPGGAVHRYADRPGTSSPVWGEGGAYHGKYIMDRNLGAMSAERETNLAFAKETRGMYYQFGRKDPFPAQDVTLYNMKFTPNSGDCIVKQNGPVSYSESIRTPYIFCYNTTGNNWTTEEGFNNQLWNDPSSGSSTKSLFDPCPPGWKLPESGIWSIFGIDNPDPSISKLIPNAKNYVEEGQNIRRDGLLFYFSAVNSGPTAWYPNAGFRTGNSGDMDRYAEDNTGGGCWTSQKVPSNSHDAYHLGLGANHAYPESAYPCSYAMNVRCVRK